jgi:hypothetical protein
LLIRWAKKHGTATDIISRASRNKPPITSAKTAWFGTNGWTQISLNQERRHRTIQHDRLNLAIGGIKLADKNKNNRMICTAETK